MRNDLFSKSGRGLLHTQARILRARGDGGFNSLARALKPRKKRLVIRVARDAKGAPRWAWSVRKASEAIEKSLLPRGTSGALKRLRRGSTKALLGVPNGKKRVGVYKAGGK